LDAASTLSWENGFRAPQTACWSNRGGAHDIRINEEIVSLINTPDMLAKPIHKRQEARYVKSVLDHEVAHGLYTSRDFKGINDLCKKFDISFYLVNLFEDARIEALMRGRRPYKVGKKMDLDHKGSPTVHPLTYGVRKFEWNKWDALKFDTPQSAFLSFVKCEGTKKNLTPYRKAFDNWAITYPKGAGCNPFKSAKDGRYRGWDFIYRYWRTVAGRGAETRYPTTESLLPLIRMFNDHFPLPPGENGRPGEGEFGPGSDFVDSAREELGDDPHGCAPKEIESGDPSTETWEGEHDHKLGGDDESSVVLDKAEANKRGLSDLYFDVEFTR
jgi:hypothetical protein